MLLGSDDPRKSNYRVPDNPRAIEQTSQSEAY